MADRDRPTAPGEGFVQRWSRRKAEARETAAAPAPSSSDPAERAPASAPVQGAAPSGAAVRAPVGSEPTSKPAQGEPAPAAPEDLPDLDSLDASSDFSVFMRPGVPEHLRSQALRKLWRSDPSFSTIDGLLEYGEDYTIQSWPTGMIQTAYQIGRGFVAEIEKLGGADLPRETASAAPEPTADAQAAIASAQADEPVTAGGGTPERTSESTAAEGGAAASAATSAPGNPRPRPLPRRG